MTLHVFNPQHDMALAANLWQFTAPKAGRKLAEDLDYLPMLWAEEGDAVLVHNLGRAEVILSRMSEVKQGVRPVPYLQLSKHTFTAVKPWGWDRSVVYDLHRLGVSTDVLPSEKTLDGIREFSHRRWAAEHLLPRLRSIDDSFVGEAVCLDHLPTWKSPMVLKSPWSCSGRGVRYALDDTQWERQCTWVSQVILRQGGIMVEPYYNKVCDLAMEFHSTPKGVSYCGLSLFNTQHGGYVGNVIATEDQKYEMIACYGVSPFLLEKLKRAISEYMYAYLRPIYTGPFGVDMMVVKDGERYRLHPCVELNLRMTMGHVALSLAERLTELPRVMAIDYHGHYSFTTI